MSAMAVWGRRLVVAVLFAALVVVLLWFQGIILRPEAETSDVPEPPRIQDTDQVVAVEARELPRIRTYPGYVEAIDPASLAPRVMASVLEVHGREGEAVRKGELIVRLDDRDAKAKLAQAEAALAAAEAEATRARLAFDRAQRLLDADALTQSEWEAARAARDASEAQVTRAKKAIEEGEAALSWFQLTAPFDGHILERNADPGDLATPGRPVVRIWREDRLRFRVAVPEEAAGDLSVGDPLRVVFDRSAAQDARLERILPASDPRTGTVTLHLSLEPAPGLRPGLLGRLELDTGSRTGLVVPEAAVERIGQVERVRLVRDGHAVPVTVRTGKRHGNMVEILGGLAEGEQVLVR
ncbi:MAG TPA: efflux RND transporter periplasmic adaptor subunit [Planctomycetes bacterium]|nr:efflux RND transporter periplasmic adaptor subunit [Planctomycetota bacterium]